MYFLFESGLLNALSSPACPGNENKVTWHSFIYPAVPSNQKILLIGLLQIVWYSWQGETMHISLTALLNFQYIRKCLRINEKSKLLNCTGKELRVVILKIMHIVGIRNCFGITTIQIQKSKDLFS